MVQVIPEIQANKEKIIKWRRHFHQHPEPSLKEYKTAEKIQEVLTSLGVPFEKVGETGTLGTITGTKNDASETQRNRKVLLRADIDALEITEATDHEFPSLNKGIMHACGHDAHNSGLLGAVEYLAKHKDQFAGTVLVAFQQAEEIGSGAYQFIESGLLDGVEQAFGMHVEPALPVGTVQAVPGPTMASCDIFTITVTGKSAHVARPHDGIDALAAGANIVTELQNLVARLLNPLEPAVIGIGKFTSGTRYNIVSNHAKIEGTLRTLSHETRERFLAKIEETAHNVAQLFGATIEFENYPAAAPNINDIEATERAQRAGAKVVGESNVIKQGEPSMGSDDFADFLTTIPGTYARVGVSSSDDTSYGLHHEKFNLDEDALPIMASLHVEFALDYLNQD
ncbi:amidohydrolase [Aerococcaceae bacterium DSM 111021]|nr:amidohydrolase [Aerococcaceae bacterium DSM 111021]